MTNKIGEKIKQLRKKADVTQEKFADYLGITFQAVSRWESGICYPDLELLPSIANYFGVTTDELLGVDIMNKQEKIKEIEDQTGKNFQKGLINDNIELLRIAINEFPNDYDLLKYLAFYLRVRGNNTQDEMDSMDSWKESVSIYERIIADCTDNGIRDFVLKDLARAYKSIGEYEKAVETAKKLPPDSSDVLLCQIYKGEELIEHMKYRIMNSVDILRRDISIFAWEKYKDISGEIGVQKRIELLQKIIDIFKIIYENGDYGFYNERMADEHEDKAFAYMYLNDFDNALDCIEKAADHAIVFDTLPEPFTYTSLLVEGYVHSILGTSKTHNSNRSYEMLKTISSNRYDPIREHERFKAVVAKLEKYAQKET